MVNQGETQPLHRIEDELTDTWIEDEAKATIEAAESFLLEVLAQRVKSRQKHEQFNQWLVARGKEPEPIDEVAFGAIPAPKVISPLSAIARATSTAEDEVSELTYRPMDEFNSHQT